MLLIKSGFHFLTTTTTKMLNIKILQLHFKRKSPFFYMSGQQRTRTELAPRKFKYRKAFKGKPPIRTGGSTVGTTLEHGQYGLRVLEACRLSAKTLHSCETAIKRAIKPTKGAKCYLRVFPDLPVCVKGNETRMGKGKGPFEYWACR